MHRQSSCDHPVFVGPVMFHFDRKAAHIYASSGQLMTFCEEICGAQRLMDTWR